MTDTITVTGVVGSEPRLHVTTQGLAIASFRLASTRRYFDRAKGTWEDGETNWYTVSGFRQLASNAIASVHKGDRVVVHGRLRVRSWENGEKKLCSRRPRSSRATTRSSSPITRKAVRAPRCLCSPGLGVVLIWCPPVLPDQRP